MPIELNQAILTVTLLVTESMVLDSGWSVVKYYGFARQRLAMRRCGSGNCGDAVYLHGDHSLVPRDRLGSVSLATDEQGYLLSQARYTPYGKVRSDWGTVMPTKFALTDQRRDGFGLMDYNARFYSPKLGRFMGYGLGLEDGSG